eukprot:scaffold184903_cov30-Tisochrysis_lutea.AAC.4
MPRVCCPKKEGERRGRILLQHEIAELEGGPRVALIGSEPQPLVCLRGIAPDALRPRLTERDEVVRRVEFALCGSHLEPARRLAQVGAEAAVALGVREAEHRLRPGEAQLGTPLQQGDGLLGRGSSACRLKQLLC